MVWRLDRLRNLLSLCSFILFLFFKKQGRGGCLFVDCCPWQMVGSFKGNSCFKLSMNLRQKTVVFSVLGFVRDIIRDRLMTCFTLLYVMCFGCLLYMCCGGCTTYYSVQYFYLSLILFDAGILLGLQLEISHENTFTRKLSYLSILRMWKEICSWIQAEEPHRISSWKGWFHSFTCNVFDVPFHCSFTFITGSLL